jgi:hypothetical protein
MANQQLPRRPWRRYLSRVAAPALAVTVLLTLGSPVGAASTTASSAALVIAEYAVATATHDRPAHVVTAADVSNAVASVGLKKVTLTLGSNIDELLGYPRLAIFMSAASFAFVCVVFPDSVGAAPKVITCPLQATMLWQTESLVLNASRQAVAAAASHDEPVSGADVVKAAASMGWSVVPTPTFTSGQGGRVKFTKKILDTFPKKSVSVTVSICVKFPRTAYGIPVQVAC